MLISFFSREDVVKDAPYGLGLEGRNLWSRDMGDISSREDDEGDNHLG